MFKLSWFTYYLLTWNTFLGPASFFQVSCRHSTGKTWRPFYSVPAIRNGPLIQLKPFLENLCLVQRSWLSTALSSMKFPSIPPYNPSSSFGSYLLRLTSVCYSFLPMIRLHNLKPDSVYYTSTPLRLASRKWAFTTITGKRHRWWDSPMRTWRRHTSNCTIDEIFEKLKGVLVMDESQRSIK